MIFQDIDVLGWCIYEHDANLEQLVVENALYPLYLAKHTSYPGWIIQSQIDFQKCALRQEAIGPQFGAARRNIFCESVADPLRRRLRNAGDYGDRHLVLLPQAISDSLFSHYGTRLLSKRT